MGPIWLKGARPGMCEKGREAPVFPASTRRTRFEADSERRAANAAPADPAPTGISSEGHHLRLSSQPPQCLSFGRYLTFNDLQLDVWRRLKLCLGQKKNYRRCSRTPAADPQVRRSERRICVSTADIQQLQATTPEKLTAS